ncbi:MAG: hypothetical protein AB8E82_19375 [Aureispira sp.]
MELEPQEQYRNTLKKTLTWQTILLVAMALFYMGVLLLALGEFVTNSFRSGPYYIFMAVVTSLLAWTAYIWINLCNNVLATRAYLKSSKEDDLIKSYQQQRLFWRHLVVVVGGLMSLVLFAFLFIVFSELFRWGIR